MMRDIAVALGWVGLVALIIAIIVDWFVVNNSWKDRDDNSEQD